MKPVSVLTQDCPLRGMDKNHWINSVQYKDEYKICLNCPLDQCVFEHEGDESDD